MAINFGDLWDRMSQVKDQLKKRYDEFEEQRRPQPLSPIPRENIIKPLKSPIPEKDIVRKPTWQELQETSKVTGTRVADVSPPPQKPVKTPSRVPEAPIIVPRNPAFSKFRVEEDVNQAITDASQKYNVPAELLFDIALQESSYDKSKVNPETKIHHGLFQFDPDTWSDMIRWGVVPEDASRFNPRLNAEAAAWSISNGYLQKWDDSKEVWGEFYEDEELKEYYNPFDLRPDYQSVKKGKVTYKSKVS